MKDIKLYKHNQETYEKIIDAWKTENKVAVIQATGTGKSYIILKCLYDFINKKKVVLAPSTYILEQLEREGGELENTTLLTYTKLSYMTNEEIESLNPSIIVFDEFHRCGADSWGTGVDKLIKSFPNAKILGTSATNVRYLDNNRDMAEELFESNVVINLGLAEAIIKDILPMPKYVSALYTFNDEINILKVRVENSSSNNKEEILKEIEIMKNKLEISKGIPVILKKHLKDNNYKFIVFCKNIEHLNEMKDIVVDWFKTSNISKNVNSYIAYSGYLDTDKEVNNFRIDNSKNTVKLLFNVDMFNEGVHIEDINGVILLRPTISPIVYYQQIGRAIQVGDTQNPVIFDFVNNFDNLGAKNFIGELKEYARIEKEKINNENALESTNKNIDIYEFMIFDEVQEAKTLFENIEENLMDYWNVMYDKLKDFYNKNKHTNVYRRFDSKLASWVRRQRTAYKKQLLDKDKIQKLVDIDFMWNVLDEKWEEEYNILKQYYQKNGNSDVSVNEDSELNQWIKYQRNQYLLGNLSKERIERLNQLNFSWNVKVKNWEVMYNKVKEFIKTNSFDDISRSNDEKLYNWVARQKIMFEHGKLDEDRIKKLEEINFPFNTLKIRWNFMYDLLVKYAQENGSCEIPHNYIYENENLGRWVHTQRNAKETLNNIEKVEKLNKINFIWNGRDYLWDTMYNGLIEYNQTYGNLSVPKIYMYNSYNLYSWIKQQRRFYKNNKMTPERIEKLNNIGFSWRVR